MKSIHVLDPIYNEEDKKGHFMIGDKDFENLKQAKEHFQIKIKNLHEFEKAVRIWIIDPVPRKIVEFH